MTSQSQGLIGVPQSQGSLPIASGPINPVTPLFDVRDYGATADGVTDDTAAIERASLAAAVVEGDIYAPEGTYLLSFFENPNFAGFFNALIIRRGCSLRGSGIGSTIFKLADNQPAYVSASIIGNANLTPVAPNGDENITLADFTLDGNGANQTTLYQGISFTRVRNLRHERVRVLNVRGTANFPPGETLGFAVLESSDISYVACEAIGTAGTQGSGFAVNQGTNVSYVNCTAHGMSHGMGFAIWTSQGIHLANCVAQQNGTNGFNVESSEDVTFAGCRAGGLSAPSATGYPHGASADLGNTGSGFVINASTHVVIDGCISSNNDNGFAFVATGAVGASAQVSNSLAANNINVGIYFDDTSLPLCRIAPSVLTPGNAFDGLFGAALGVLNVDFAIPAPAMPASGVVYTNPYPFSVVIYIAGASFFIMLNGANINIVDGTVMLHSGSTIQMNYGVAPAWTWFRL